MPDLKKAEEMENLIKSVRKEGDTIGGVVSCIIKNVPVGIGEPVFDKLHAELGKAMLSINAVKGFEYGSGFAGVKMKGSEHNDQYEVDESTKTNYSGGIQGGISNGMDIYFNVAFKPVATIMKDQRTIDNKGKETSISGKGRHDPCVVPRAVPIVEAMASLVILDMILINNSKNYEKISLHWKIIIGMFLGVILGLLFSSFNGGSMFITNWIKPFELSSLIL